VVAAAAIVQTLQAAAGHRNSAAATPAPLVIHEALPPPKPSEAKPAQIKGDPSFGITSDDYPPSSQRNGEEGVTSIAYDIGTDGRISNCHVTGRAALGHSTKQPARCRPVELVTSRRRMLQATRWHRMGTAGFAGRSRKTSTTAVPWVRRHSLSPDQIDKESSGHAECTSGSRRPQSLRPAGNADAGRYRRPAVFGILLIMSAASWYILFTKLFEQQKIMSQGKKMRSTFWSSPSVREGANKLERTALSPDRRRWPPRPGRAHQADRSDRCA